MFAEHRGYGQSPLAKAGAPPSASLAYLTAEQALADYAALLFALKRELADAANAAANVSSASKAATSAASIPAIAFGGSYGGMLASWLRMHYPGAVDGAVAASAPILAFDGAWRIAWSQRRQLLANSVG